MSSRKAASKTRPGTRTTSTTSGGDDDAAAGHDDGDEQAEDDERGRVGHGEAPAEDGDEGERHEQGDDDVGQHDGFGAVHGQRRRNRPRRAGSPTGAVRRRPAERRMRSISSR